MVTQTAGREAWLRGRAGVQRLRIVPFTTEKGRLMDVGDTTGHLAVLCAHSMSLPSAQHRWPESAGHPSPDRTTIGWSLKGGKGLGAIRRGHDVGG